MNIQIVIDIPEEDYKGLQEKDKFNDMCLGYYEKLIVYGTPLSIGNWIDVAGGCECSECGCLEVGYSNFCPDCGAKMEVEE